MAKDYAGWGYFPHLKKLGYDAQTIREWARLRNTMRVQARVCSFCRFVFTKESPVQLDHRIPHRGDKRLLLDPTNLQFLCAVCHNSTKKRMENGTARRATGLDGYPVDEGLPKA